MSERDVLQLLKMVRTAEHKLRPRGLFRAKAKGKQRDKKVPARLRRRPTARRARTPPRSAHADGRRARCRTARCGRVRVRVQPQAAGMAQLLAQPGPPPPPSTCITTRSRRTTSPACRRRHRCRRTARRAAAPRHAAGRSTSSRRRSMSLRHRLRRSSRTVPPHHAFRRRPVQPPLRCRAARQPPPLMDQFSSPPPEHCAEPPPPQLCAAARARGQWRAFAVQRLRRPDAADGRARHAAAAAGHEAPFEPNPLLAALAQRAAAGAASPSAARSRRSRRRTGCHAPRHRNARAGNGAANGAGNGAKPAARRTVPDFSGLPPAMAESLAKLAGVPWPPRPEEDERELEAQAAGPLPGTPRREG